MRTTRWWLAAALALFAGAAAAQGPAVLQSGGVRLSVDRGTGDIASLTVRGREMLAGPSRQFTLRLTRRDDRTSRWVDNGQTGASVTAAADRIVVSSPAADGWPAVRVVWSCGPEGGLAVRAWVGAPSAGILESVSAPALKLRAAADGDTDGTRLFVPGGDGYTVSHAGMKAAPWNGRTYPGTASMQFMALYGARGGLTLQCLDERALPKSFEAPYDATTDSLEMRIVHLRPFVEGAGAEVPRTVVRPCGGTWESPAGLYRHWARRQWWARPKRGSAAPPAWLDTSLITLGGSLRPLGIGKLAVEPGQWPDVVRRLKQATGAKGVLLDLREWEHDGIYTSPYYFPLHPSDEQVRRTLADAVTAGARASAMVAGLQWVIEREAYTTDTYCVTAFDGRERFEREGRPVCVVNRDGAVQVDAPYFTWDGSKAKMCPHLPFAQAHFPATARRLALAGFRIFEFDQMNGGSCPPCYATGHGHPPGPGDWARQAVDRFMAATRAEGRRVTPEFATSLEDPCEVFLPRLDSYISRAAHTTEWPANGEGSEVVPAFAFVYGPLARALCFDVQHSVTPDPYQLLLTMRAAAGGCIPSTNLGLFGVLAKYGKDNLLPTPEKLDRPQLELLAAVTRARGGPLLPFISRGEMMAVEQPRVPAVAWAFRVWEKDRFVDRSLKHAPVLARGWRMADGRRAFEFINGTAQTVRFPYDFGTEGRESSGSEIATLWHNGTVRGQRTPAKLATVAVAPLSVVTVVIGPERTATAKPTARRPRR